MQWCCYGYKKNLTVSSLSIDCSWVRILGLCKEECAIYTQISASDPYQNCFRQPSQSGVLKRTCILHSCLLISFQLTMLFCCSFLSTRIMQCVTAVNLFEARSSPFCFRAPKVSFLLPFPMHGRMNGDKLAPNKNIPVLREKSETKVGNFLWYSESFDCTLWRVRRDTELRIFFFPLHSLTKANCISKPRWKPSYSIREIILANTDWNTEKENLWLRWH